MSIPLQMRAEMAEDPFYAQCCVTGRPGRIQWHHNARFGGSNIQQKFAIMPLDIEIHSKIDYYKELCDWIMVNRMSDEELTRYTKATDYHFEKKKLNAKYGEWSPKWYLHKSFD